ncbi:uncharacterized protein LOC143022266 [Oratosquilla oratoria]|uniref:uncharacterized protein LOC143022266 n=1 Tax=Oratosquilla oratoria TaxID=337810 RepID=UPI003F75902E
MARCLLKKSYVNSNYLAFKNEYCDVNVRDTDEAAAHETESVRQGGGGTRGEEDDDDSEGRREIERRRAKVLVTPLGCPKCQVCRSNKEDAHEDGPKEKKTTLRTGWGGPEGLENPVPSEDDVAPEGVVDDGSSGDEMGFITALAGCGEGNITGGAGGVVADALLPREEVEVLEIITIPGIADKDNLSELLSKVVKLERSRGESSPPSSPHLGCQAKGDSGGSFAASKMPNVVTSSSSTVPIESLGGLASTDTFEGGNIVATLIALCRRYEQLIFLLKEENFKLRRSNQFLPDSQSHGALPHNDLRLPNQVKYLQLTPTTRLRGRPPKMYKNFKGPMDTGGFISLERPQLRIRLQRLNPQTQEDQIQSWDTHRVRNDTASSTEETTDLESPSGPRGCSQTMLPAIPGVLPFLHPPKAEAVGWQRQRLLPEQVDSTLLKVTLNNYKNICICWCTCARKTSDSMRQQWTKYVTLFPRILGAD